MDSHADQLEFTKNVGAYTQDECPETEISADIHGADR